ncbi:alcohol dehydrogenase catalytic domain-containing protein [Pseudooceanicola sp.]|uniref:zinc-dependent alcohol dehydrogenase n=1 Tax=Pseudooceanicola sp. TaxID=1914328 RepID=UPI00260CFE85|nr:alcohol dehydrogenase catalytic domain-containing protein [Pseudooceanicola sp.]MDF1854410.1 alcohol dehydrogenase catalytic domain-containing protein [Pseudooceanicola sp.]
MQALRKVAAQGGVTLEEVPDPKRPEGTDVVVEVAAVGICGSDLHVDDWTPGYEFMTDLLPVTLGHEFAGRVTAVGPDVTQLAVGDRVAVMPAAPCHACPACRAGDSEKCQNKQTLGLYRDGAFAGKVLARASGCLPIPDALDFELAALTEPLAVAATAVRVGGVGQGDRVVVLGPGIIGQAVAIFARLSGAAEVAICGFDDALRLDACRSLGFERLYDLAEDGTRERLMAEMGGADLVFEATGQSISVTDGLALLRMEGILVMLGIHCRDAQFSATDFVRRRLQIRASHSSRRREWTRVIDAMARDPELFRKMISHRLPLNEAVRGFGLAHEKAASKVMIFPN